MPQTDVYLIGASQSASMPPLGGELRLDVQLTPAPPPSNRVVQGTVKGPTGAPLEGAAVKVFSSTLDPVAHTNTNPEGRYVFNQLAPGTYAISAFKPPYIPPAVQVFTLPASGVLNIDISLMAPFPGTYYSAIYGKVAGIQGSPVAGATVNINSVDEMGQETLFAQTTTNASGQYYTINLPPGIYTVQASAPGYQLSVKVTVPNSGSEYVPVDLTLAVDPLQTLGTVSGVITDTSGNVIPYAFVALYEVMPSGETLIDLTRAQVNGLYVFAGVAPGKTYRVKAKVVNFDP